MVKQIERESEITESAAAQLALSSDETLAGDELRTKIREIMYGDKGYIIWRNCHRICSFIEKKLLSVNGRQYYYLFRRFTDDLSLCEPIFPDQLDTGNYLNFLNGTMEITNPLQWHEHNPEHFITKVARCPYVEEPPFSPLFEQWMENIPTGDVVWLQAFYGQAISGASTEKVFLSMVDAGEGNSGKSATTLPLFVGFGVHPGGGYVAPGLQTSFSPSSFSNPGAPREDLVTITKANIIVVPEARRGPISGELIKSLISGGSDYLGYRGNHASVEGRINKATLIFVGNELPIFDQTDGPLNDRHFMIEFAKIPIENRDSEFPKKMKADLNFRIAFVAWVVRGLKTFQYNSQGLTGKDTTLLPHQGMVAKQRSDVRDNILDEWIREDIDARQGARTTARLLYESNLTYRIKAGEKRIGKRQFYNHLELYILARKREEEWLNYNRRTGAVQGFEVLLERGQMY